MGNKNNQSNRAIRMKRRQFLQYGAAATSGLLITSGLSAQSANDKLNIACIGIGGQGRSNLNSIDHENIVALCDVDDERAGDAYEKHPKAKKFYDYRVMLDKMGNEIDAVVVSTPDHTHFHPAMAAMDMGKHLYCEKPMAHAVDEIRQMTELARKNKLATQLGMQRHVKDNMHRVVELIKTGAIGDVTAVYAWKGGNRGMPDMPTEFPEVPDHLKWDLWQGPAEARKYSPAYCPYNWRFWWDYGTGETGNWGCHILDIPYWALDLHKNMPNKVSAWGPPVDPERSPTSMFSKFNFPEWDGKPALELHWYHTNDPIPFFEEHGIPKRGNNLFVGTKGMLLTGFDEHELYPKEKYADFEYPEPFIPESPGFRQEWINACKGGEPATCNFEYSGPLAETVILANVAYRAETDFEWNAKTLQAKNAPKAEPYIRPTYREGWKSYTIAAASY